MRNREIRRTSAGEAGKNVEEECFMGKVNQILWNEEIALLQRRKLIEQICKPGNKGCAVAVCLFGVHSQTQHFVESSSHLI